MNWFLSVSFSLGFLAMFVCLRDAQIDGINKAFVVATMVSQFIAGWYCTHKAIYGGEE